VHVLQVDTTIMGSRNGQAALFMWHSLRRKGVEGIKADVQLCLATARYLRDTLLAHGVRARLNDLSTTVVLERPVEDAFVQRWQLACEEDIAHVVVMPNVTEKKVDYFVAELARSIEAHGHQRELRDNSPLALLSSEAWGGALGSEGKKE
jgi:histidine decarboxylase